MQPVADAVDRRYSGGALDPSELAPQPREVDVDRVVMDECALWPARAHQVTAANSPPGVRRECAEETELCRAEACALLVAAPDLEGGRVEGQAGRGQGVAGTRALEQRAQTRLQLGGRERLGEVVVAPGAEARQAVGQGIPRGEEHDRGLDAARAQRLAQVPPVGVGQADVDDERSRGAAVNQLKRLGRTADPGDGEVAVLLQAAPDERAQLRIVLDQQDLCGSHAPSIAEHARSSGYCSRRISPRRRRRIPRAAAAVATRVAATEALARPARKPQGIASASGGGSNTCWSIATSIALRRTPSPSASTRPAARTTAASVHTNAETRDRGAPIAAIVANSLRRSEIPSATNRAIAAAARTIAKACSMWLMPVRSTVVIALPVREVWLVMFSTLVPSVLVAAAT